MNLETVVSICWVIGILFAWFVIWAYRIKRRWAWFIISIPLGWVGFLGFLVWFIELIYIKGIFYLLELKECFNHRKNKKNE